MSEVCFGVNDCRRSQGFEAAEDGVGGFAAFEIAVGAEAVERSVAEVVGVEQRDKAQAGVVEIEPSRCGNERDEGVAPAGRFYQRVVDKPTHVTLSAGAARGSGARYIAHADRSVAELHLVLA